MNFLILMGGEGRRIREKKAYLRVGGIRIVDRIINELEKVKNKDEEILLVVNKKTSFKKIKRWENKIKVVEDIIPGKGPLGGIYSGLSLSNAKFNFITGCDMPFLNWKFIHYMRSLPKDYDILIPLHSRGVEPLHAIYSKSCLSLIKEKLEQGEYKIRAILPYLKIRFVEEKEIRKFDSPEYIFFNINTREDLAKARKLVKLCFSSACERKK